MPALRSPTVILILAMHLAAAALAFSVWVICSTPDLGVRFESGRLNQVEMRTAAGRRIAQLPAEAKVVFRRGDETVVQSADELRTMFLPMGRPAELERWYHARGALQDMAQAGQIELETTAGDRQLFMLLSPRARMVAEIPFDIWLMLILGLAPFVIATWLWALRPADWAARCYGLSGVCLLAMFHTTAIWIAKGPVGGEAMLWGLAIVNFLASETGFWITAALFMWFPKPLIRPRLAHLAIPGAFMAAAALGPTYFGVKLVFPAILAAFLVALGLGLAQWRASREDPVARAILSWFGLAILAGSAIGVAAFVAPRLGGGPPLVPSSFAILPVLISYVGVAVGVGRFRLFDLDRWSYQVLAVAIAAAVMLVFDALLVTLLQLQPRTALGLSIALIAVLYIPLKDFLWRTLAGKVAPVNSALFQQAAEVAFTADPEARRDAWREMLNQLFKPLQVEAAGGDQAAAAIGDNGLELIAPAAAGEGPLILRYRDGGRRLFNAEHLALVRELTSFMVRAEGARDAFRRGVLEERGRIARDLHDDVGARLLSSLHRPDTEGVRSDVRTALADMRTLVADLVGQDTTLTRLFADLRRETADRLEAAGLELDWPVEDDPPDRAISHRVYRHLRSACREAISNVVKHARASRVEVRVNFPPDRLRVTITDDGIGLGKAEPGQGVGLGSMRARLEQVGGTVTIEDADRGARVEIEAPV